MSRLESPHRRTLATARGPSATRPSTDAAATAARASSDQRSGAPLLPGVAREPASLAQTLHRFCDEQDTSGSCNEQTELLRYAPRRAVVEKNALRLNLDGQRQRLLLAIAEGVPQNGWWQGHRQVLHSQPGRQCRN